jgi:hypothetical protein
MESRCDKKCVTVYKIEKSRAEEIRKQFEAPGQFVELSVRDAMNCTRKALVNKKHVLWVEAEPDESTELRMLDAFGK